MGETRMNKGLTLIALAVTIIVILILVTVVISTITDDSIIMKTDKAVLKKYEADAKEHVALAWTFLEDYYGQNISTIDETKAEFFSKDNLNQYIDDKEGEIKYSDGIKYIIYSSFTSHRTYLFEITDNNVIENKREVKTDEFNLEDFLKSIE